MSSASSAFTKSLRATVAPVLREKGFSYDGRRTFRRLRHGEAIAQIINFQLGQRSLEGKFTVNLGVYVPEDFTPTRLEPTAEKAHEYSCSLQRRCRLGVLVPGRLSVLSGVPVLGALFAAQDKWWRFSGDQSETQRSLSLVVSLMEEYAYEWLEKATPPEAWHKDDV